VIISIVDPLFVLTEIEVLLFPFFKQRISMPVKAIVFEVRILLMV
jgi:hypothetical protein